MSRQKTLYFKNKVESYQKDLEIEMQFIKNIETEILELQTVLTAESQHLSNTTFVELSSKVVNKRATLQRAKNRAETLREKIKLNSDIHQKIK